MIVTAPAWNQTSVSELYLTDCEPPTSAYLNALGYAPLGEKFRPVWRSPDRTDFSGTFLECEKSKRQSIAFPKSTSANRPLVDCTLEECETKARVAVTNHRKVIDRSIWWLLIVTKLLLSSLSGPSTSIFFNFPVAIRLTVQRLNG